MEQFFYIVRHGETDFNRSGVVQGSGIDSDLNETGRRQADAFYQSYKHIPFDTIYISKLKRTAQSVAQFIDRGHRVKMLEELNEIGWGDFEGKPIDAEMHQRYLDIIGRWQAGELDVAYSNAETPLQMWGRQQRALELILENRDDKNVLIVTHGRYLRGFICLLLDHPLHRMDDFSHSNLCLYVLKYDGKKFELVAQDNTAHLAGL
jgi:broad specificity phosphatase PhoE